MGCVHSGGALSTETASGCSPLLCHCWSFCPRPLCSHERHVLWVAGCSLYPTLLWKSLSPGRQSMGKLAGNTDMGGECSLFEDGTSPSEKGWSSLNKIRSQVTTIPVACVHPTGCYGLQLSRTMEKNGICIQIRHIQQSRLLQGRSRYGHERKQILLHRYPNSEPQACLPYTLTIILTATSKGRISSS